MGSSPQGTPFDVQNFPDLYPKNLQDEINETYDHDKVLPREEGKDYNVKTVDIAHEDEDETSAQEGKETSSGEA